MQIIILFYHYRTLSLRIFMSFVNFEWIVDYRSQRIENTDKHTNIHREITICLRSGSQNIVICIERLQYTV